MRKYHKENNECISIIVPVYQAEKYIEKCIESIINQSYYNLQIILVDDGSTDRSGIICDMYAKKDERIEVHHIENSGSVVARKVGINRAYGRFIGFVDSDDYIDNEMFECLYDSIIGSDADFVHSWFWTVKNDALLRDPFNEFDDTIIIKSKEDRFDAYNRLFFGDERNQIISPSLWSKLYKADFIKKHYNELPNYQAFGEDLLCLFSCLSDCEKIRIISKRFYNYQIFEGSLSHVNENKFFFERINLLSSLIQLNTKLNLGFENNIFYQWSRVYIWNTIVETANHEKKFNAPQYFFKDIKKLQNERIIIYGDGAVGRDYVKQLELMKMQPPIAIIDKDVKHLEWNQIRHITPDEINCFEYDRVLIAINNKDTADSIKEQLIEIGIPINKIIWEKPQI